MKISNYKYLIALFAFVFSFALQSCEEDDDYDVKGTTENFVFINSGNWAPIGVSDGVLFNTVKTPVETTVSGIDLEAPEVSFSIQCSRPAAEDIVVKLAIDNSTAIEGYEPFPSGVSLALSKTEFTIPKGAMSSSEALTVSVPLSQVELLSTGSYMASIVISTVSGATLRDDQSSFAMFLAHEVTNVKSNLTSLEGSGTTPDRSSWKGVVKYTDGSGVYSESDQSSVLFDNNSRTYFFNTPDYEPAFELEFDLGQVYTDVTAFRLRYYSSSYAIGSANIYVSSTGTDNYELLKSGSFPAASSHYLNFYEPIKARYIKVEVLAPVYSYGTVFADFYIYQ